MLRRLNKLCAGLRMPILGQRLRQRPLLLRDRFRVALGAHNITRTQRPVAGVVNKVLFYVADAGTVGASATKAPFTPVFQKLFAVGAQPGLGRSISGKYAIVLP